MYFSVLRTNGEVWGRVQKSARNDESGEETWRLRCHSNMKVPCMTFKDYKKELTGIKIHQNKQATIFQ